MGGKPSKATPADMRLKSNKVKNQNQSVSKVPQPSTQGVTMTDAKGAATQAQEMYHLIANKNVPID